MNDQDPRSGTNDNKDMRGPSRSFLKVCVDFWGLALTYKETIRARPWSLKMNTSVTLDSLHF